MQDIIFAMEKGGLPKKVTFVISSAIQLIPQMSALSKTITDAQRSSRIETEGSLMVRAKAFVPMLRPLLLSSIQQIEERVLALESQASSSKAKKISIYEICKTGADHVLSLLSLLAIIAYIVWRAV